MGGGKTPKQKISKQEVHQAQQATAKWNERIDDGYLALEKQGVKDASQDHSGVIGGRSSADLAIAERAGLRDAVAAGASNRDVTSLGNTIADAETTRRVDTDAQAMAMKDSRRVAMTGVGQDVAHTAGAGLRDAAQIGGARANNKVQNKIMVDNAKFGAVMDVVGGAASGAALRSEGFRMGKSGLSRTHEGGLRGAALDNPELDKKGNQIGWTQLAGGF